MESIRENPIQEEIAMAICSGWCLKKYRYAPIPTKENKPITRPFNPPTPISFPTKVIFCFAVRRSSIRTRMVTARDWVPTFPDISRISDWKAMIMVSCATTVSKRPTTVETTRPRKREGHDNGKLCYHGFKKTYYGGNNKTEEKQNHKPGKAFFHTFQKRFI